MVVAPETTPEGALILAERIRCGVESAATTFKGQTIKVTVSVGMAVAEAGVSAGFDQMKYVAAAGAGGGQVDRPQPQRGASGAASAGSQRGMT